ncbi:hypothetical protein ARAF_0464 [Arsenophonus endosymbiont of Aleurodicus floccissimus]|uniref:hypothetical protein n=1 Tax=Arsenophonus endosymbiont of Aleurodicus floccissimus TaxID=2152761 RepID=UPI000E6AEBB8|nr:hypothetical protein [Arsenophonus endosymbiont of Aleurodicus floccissimus]SPP31341.1 hypothetical protein ARAF_0464 [Arsenophonus endosymbiont of Aleurodicus floccissimus]
MKLLYKAFIVIVLLSCHLMSAIADNTHISPTSTITDTYRHNSNQDHSYDEINAILDKNYFQCYVMAQQNIDFAKYAFNENMDLMKYTVKESFKLAHSALNGSTITHNEQLLTPTLEFSNNITNKTLETGVANIDKILTTTQISSNETYKSTNMAIKKSLETYGATNVHNGSNLTDPTTIPNTDITTKTYNSGSPVYSDNDTNLEIHDEHLTDLNRDYP